MNTHFILPSKEFSCIMLWLIKNVQIRQCITCNTDNSAHLIGIKHTVLFTCNTAWDMGEKKRRWNSGWYFGCTQHKQDKVYLYGVRLSSQQYKTRCLCLENPTPSFTSTPTQLISFPTFSIICPFNRSYVIDTGRQAAIFLPQNITKVSFWRK